MRSAFQEHNVIRRKSVRALAVLLGTTALVALPSGAEAKDWTGANSNVWTDSLNWNPTGEPAAADQVFITVPGNVLIVGGATAVASQLDLSPGGAGGSVQISNGSALTLGGPAVLGRTAGTDGTVVVGNGSSMFVDNGNLDVGDAGTASIYVENGGFLSVGANAGNFAAGRSAGGIGRIVVDGSGSRIASGGLTVVGAAGDGRLTIKNGGLIEGVDVSIGNQIGGTGAAFVSGPGSRWENSGSIIVGNAGNGSLMITNGGVVKGHDGVIGSSGSGNGQVSVDGGGSLWETGSALYVGSPGASGTGTLSVTNGGTVLSSMGFVGSEKGGTGTATVDGAGSLWDVTSDLFVGGAGQGTLSVLNGGAVKTSVGTIGNLSGHLGIVTVDGAGSTWQISQDLLVAENGTGSLTISNGGLVTSNFGSVGNSSGGTGTVLITGAGSNWTTNNDLAVGHSGTGIMGVVNGGSVSSKGGQIAFKPASSGEVFIDGAGTSWTVAGDLGIGLTLGSRGTLTVSNGGAVHVGGAVDVALVPGATGELNIGAAPGDPATGAGIVTATEIHLGVGTASINFNHTDTSYDFSVAISGTGTVNQFSGTTILTGNSGAFAGLTAVYGGTLTVNGSLGGRLDVLAGRLQGTGTVGDVLAVGTIAPGKSIGTINVGNITFNAGSIYEVEVNAAGQSDKIVVAGMATIDGGSVKVLAGMGNYAPATTYTILTANGGRSGTFTGGVTSDLVFLDPSLSYDANNVYLTMTRNNADFAAIGHTPNQIATGGGVESLGFGNPVYNAVLNLSADQAEYAFDQLSGEIHASARTALIEDSRFVRNAVNDRMRAAFDAAKGDVVASVDGKPIPVSATTDRFALWSQGFGSWGHTDGDGNAARLERKTAGVFVGADAPLFDIWRFGAVAGYSRIDFDVNSRHASGSSDNYHAGLYGGTQWGDLAFQAGAAYTWQDISTSRNVAFPGFSDSLKGDYNGATAQVFGEFAYGFNTDGAGFEPFANIAYVNLHTDGFTEQGGAAALTSPSANTDATFTTLGLRASTMFDLNGASITTKGTLGWRHAFGDDTPEAAMLFAGGGDAFTIGGVPITRDAAVIEAGLDYVITPNATLGITYGGQFGSGMADQSVNANIDVRF